jgi:exodeoxyribonuclease VII large subunit
MSQATFDLDDVGEPTFSVGELTDAVNQVLRRGFLDGVWVRGEIEGYQQRGNHVYFSLTDHDGDRRATIAVALFANIAMRLRPLLARHRLRLRDGLTVRVHGRLDLYAATGKLSLVMDGLDPTFTLGQLAADRDQLLRRLVGEGLLDANKRRPLPMLPLRVGVVASRDSAAWHDLVHELTRSAFAFHLVHVDVRVQGVTAPDEVAAAIRALGRRAVDVIVVVRGGGARSDLAAFDSEPIARAIAASPVPVLTGLGHEIDRSVADEVAHTALKTPTACAQHLVERVQHGRDRSELAWAGIARRADRRLDLASHRSDRLARAIAARCRGAHGYAEQRLELAASRLSQRGPRVADVAGHRLDGIEARVRSLDPSRALARGWTITRRADGSLVRSADVLAAGDVVVTTFLDGQARSRVEGP